MPSAMPENKSLMTLRRANPITAITTLDTVISPVAGCSNTSSRMMIPAAANSAARSRSVSSRGYATPPRETRATRTSNTSRQRAASQASASQSQMPLI